MNKIINTKHQIAYNSLQLALALVDLDQKTRYYGTEDPIFYSEIHIIMAIAEHPGIHVGGLAEILGVTKGAVSEILKKLEKKDLIIKEIDNLNLSRYSLNLTEKGKKAHKNHKKKLRDLLRKKNTDRHKNLPICVPYRKYYKVEKRGFQFLFERFGSK